MRRVAMAGRWFARVEFSRVDGAGRAQGAAEVLELRKQSVVVGRHPATSDVKLKDTTVSGRHCTFKLGKDQGGEPRLEVWDSSSNGTFVNDARIAKGKGVALKVGDVVELSKSSFLANAKKGDATCNRFKVLEIDPDASAEIMAGAAAATKPAPSLPSSSSSPSLKRRRTASKTKDPGLAALEQMREVRKKFEEEEIRVRAEFEQRVSELESECNRLAEDCAAKEKRMENLDGDKLRLQEAFDGVRDELARVKTDHKKEVMDLEAAKERLEGVVQRKDADLASAKDEVAMYKEQKKGAELALEQSRKRFSAFKEEARQQADVKLNARLKEAQGTIKLLQDKLSAAHASVNEAQARADKMSALFGSFAEQFTEFSKANEDDLAAVREAVTLPQDASRRSTFLASDGAENEAEAKAETDTQIPLDIVGQEGDLDDDAASAHTQQGPPGTQLKAVQGSTLPIVEDDDEDEDGADEADAASSQGGHREEVPTQLPVDRLSSINESADPAIHQAQTAVEGPLEGYDDMDDDMDDFEVPSTQRRQPPNNSSSSSGSGNNSNNNSVRMLDVMPTMPSQPSSWGSSE